MNIPKTVKKLAGGSNVEYKGTRGGKEYYYVPPEEELIDAVTGFPVVISYERGSDSASFVESPECFDFT